MKLKAKKFLKAGRPSKASELERDKAKLAALEKQLAEVNFHEFVKQAWHVLEPDEPYCDNWHIKALCLHIEAVTDGRIPNLLANVPPGTMKSMLVCVMWPAWVWTVKPAKRFLFSSYSEDLAMRDSRKCRQLLASNWFQERWPLRFSDSQDTKGKFENEHKGWRMVGSIKGRGIGEHPDYFGLDDPHNVLQVESDAERMAVTTWVEGVFSTRGVIRDVKRICIMQRLHAQDASGTLLDKGGWCHICLPMRYELPEEQEVNGVKQLIPRMKPTPLGWTDPRTRNGELLWPAKYPANKVDELEINLGLYQAAGQLQQRPTPRGGGKFKRAWFDILGTAPVCRRLVRYWDKAGTKGGRGAQSCGVLMGEFEDTGAAIRALRTKYIILDVVTCREEAAERETIIKNTAAADNKLWGYVETWVEQEPGSGGKESAQSTVGNLAGFTCNFERVTGSKEVRAEPMASQASVGKLKILAAHWNSEYLQQLEQFPLGKLKDMVDGSSGAFNKLCAQGGGMALSDLVPPPPQEDLMAGMDLDAGRLEEADL